MSIQTRKLNSGYKIPVVGLGCWLGKPGQKGENHETEEMVANALKAGYKHFDTASGYGNEEAVGKAIRESGISRSSLFVTTKIAFDHSNVPKSFQTSLDQLGLDYIDLYLVHWPQALDPTTGKFGRKGSSPTIQDTWHEMEKLLATGKVRSIGVSNHSVENLTLLLETATVVPAVNQVEAHPYNPQTDLVKLCEEKGIHLTAYCPLGQYNSPVLADPAVVEIATAHDKTSGQISLSWAVQRGNWSVVPKSSNPVRLAQNLQTFSLSEEEMEVISKLHLEPGKFRNLCQYTMGNDGVAGPEREIFGWTLAELGWDPKAFE